MRTVSDRMTKWLHHDVFGGVFPDADGFRQNDKAAFTEAYTTTCTEACSQMRTVSDRMTKRLHHDVYRGVFPDADGFRQNDKAAYTEAYTEACT